MKTLPEQIGELLPNLDGINDADEMEARREDFHVLRNGFQSLVNYTEAKEEAIICRKAGKIQLALKYERVADEVYHDLPKWAKW